MTKVKLVDGTIINANSIELENGVLKITTTDRTVEGLVALFGNKENTNLLTFFTESGKESGFKTGFTSFAGIVYMADGSKVVELYQPANVTEVRLSSAEGIANQAINSTAELSNTVNAMLGV